MLLAHILGAVVGWTAAMDGSIFCFDGSHLVQCTKTCKMCATNEYHFSNFKLSYFLNDDNNNNPNNNV